MLAYVGSNFPNDSLYTRFNLRDKIKYFDRLSVYLYNNTISINAY